MERHHDTPIERSVFFHLDIKTLDTPGQFEGYASTFGGKPDRQGDVIQPGAFAATLKENEGRVPILYGHFGRAVGFGLSAEEDKRGLKVVGEFSLNTDDGRNSYESAKHAARVGARLGLSIGYMVRKDGWEYDEQTNIRTLKSLDLLEYSIAPVPANPRAAIARVKSGSTTRELEEILTTLGLSQREAARFLSMAKAHRDGAAGLDLSRGYRDGDSSQVSDELMSLVRTLDLKCSV